MNVIEIVYMYLRAAGFLVFEGYRQIRRFAGEGRSAVGGFSEENPVLPSGLSILSPDHVDVSQAVAIDIGIPGGKSVSK